MTFVFGGFSFDATSTRIFDGPFGLGKTKPSRASSVVSSLWSWNSEPPGITTSRGSCSTVTSSSTAYPDEILSGTFSVTAGRFLPSGSDSVQNRFAAGALGTLAE
ncbi:MAG: hypothetical protein QM784_25105 [Polyangiaceae bacterium]